MPVRRPQIDPSGRTPRRQLGHRLIDGVSYQLVDVGDFATSYTARNGDTFDNFYSQGNVVEFDGDLYLCILQTSKPPQDPTNTTYWEIYYEKRNFLGSDRLWQGHGPWIYVGQAGGPAFLNSWHNQGGGLQEMRFRYLIAGGVELQGSITGGNFGDPAFNISGFVEAIDIPDEEVRLDGSQDDGSFLVWRLMPNADVIPGLGV